MALYEYKCPECGGHFDEMRPMRAADEPANCPDCETESLRVILQLRVYNARRLDDVVQPSHGRPDGSRRQ